MPTIKWVYLYLPDELYLSIHMNCNLFKIYARPCSWWLAETLFCWSIFSQPIFTDSRLWHLKQSVKRKVPWVPFTGPTSSTRIHEIHRNRNNQRGGSRVTTCRTAIPKFYWNSFFVILTHRNGLRKYCSPTLPTQGYLNGSGPPREREQTL